MTINIKRSSGSISVSSARPARGRVATPHQVPSGYPYDAFDLDFTNPASQAHRRPLPMVAHFSGSKTNISAETYTLVKDEGAVPVFHLNTENDLSRFKRAMAAAQADRENTLAEMESVLFHLAARRMSKN